MLQSQRRAPMYSEQFQQQISAGVALDQDWCWSFP